MDEKKNHIDEFYREALGGYSQGASGFAWMRMSWRLLWINYSRYLIAIGALVVIGTGLFLGISNTRDVHSPVLEINEDEILTQTTSQVNPDPESTGIPAATETGEEAPGLKEPNESFSDKALATNEAAISANPVVFPPPEKATFLEIDIPSEPMSYNENFDMLNSQESEASLAIDDAELSDQAYKEKYLALNENIQLKKSWISLGFYVAPALNFYRMESPDQDYLNYREAHEKPAVSWSAGADFRINIRNWYIQTGLTYSTYTLDRNYNHSFEALDSLKSYYQTDTIWGWVFDPPDINKPIALGYDTTFVPVYNDINEGSNEWHYLEIPLLAGYKFNTGRFSFDIGTGFSYGFLVYTKGNIPDPEKENTFTDLQDVEMNDQMFNYLLQLGVSYHLTPAWSLNVSPWYKHNLNSVFENNNPVDQRFRTIGINFGLRVDL